MKGKITLVLLTVFVFLIVGCGKSNTGEGVDMVVNTVDPSDFTIVRSADASSTVSKAASELCTAFAKNAGAKVNVATDSDPERSREIIIGETTRSVDTADLKLGLGEYCINMVGDKILILGGSDRAVADGVRFAIDHLIVDNTFKAPTKGGYRGENKALYNSISIDGVPISEYTVVYDLYDATVAKKLADEIADIGCTLPVVSADEFDFESGKYILLKDTNTDFSTHSVTVEDGNVTLFANYVTINDCVDYFFSDMLKYDTENDKITGSRDVNITSELSKTFTVENTPIYTKEKLLEVLGEVYEDEDSLIIAQHTYGVANGRLVETERKRYKENCGVDVPMIGYDIVDTCTATKNERVKEAYDFIQFMREGGIVTFSIHLTNPINPEAAYRGKPFTAQNWNDLLTEGTEINTFLMKQLSMIADFLEIFQKNGAPVIFRPLHEMNGDWFWFCITNPETGETISSETAQNFWKLIYNYMTETRGITNMLWEYSPNVASSAANVMHYYPGDDYCDLVACDWYTSEYTGHRQLSISEGALRETGKIFSLAEFGPSGNIITDFDISKEYKFDCGDLDVLINEVLDDGIKVAYWMLWSSYNQVKISMWNMGEAQFFYENDIYLTLEDTFDLLYN